MRIEDSGDAAQSISGGLVVLFVREMRARNRSKEGGGIRRIVVAH